MNMKKKQSVLTAIFVLLLFSAVLTAQDKQSASVDEYVKTEMKNRNIPGLSLAVIKDGKIIKESAYGLASVELNVPATVNTVYPIASTTKPFTSTAVMTLVDAGKLKLDDTLQTLLPDVPEKWRGVTVKQMLTHISGLPDVAVQPGRGDLIADTREEAMKKLAEMPLQFKPGERWSYDQTNYVLLGMIIEKLSGVSFEEYIRQHFFVPLGMTSTSYGDANDVIAGRATTYQKNKAGQLLSYPLIFPEYVRTAAGINTTVDDFAKWIIALNRDKLVKPSTRDQMWEAIKLNDGSTFRLDKKTIGYGAGWTVNDFPGHKSVGHSGGGTTAFAYFIEDKLAIIVLGNGRTNPDALLNGIAAVYIPDLAAAK